MTLCDSHCHLADRAFADDLEPTVARARAAGLRSALCILAAGDDDEAVRGSRVADVWPDVRFAVGVHPHSAARHGAPEHVMDALRQAVAARSASAIGEIGLDFHYDFCPQALQRDVFSAQLHVARELDLPVVIHTRDAEHDTFEILESDGRGLSGVLHCFTGNRAMARRALDLGFHISFAGIVTFPKAVELREVARFVPADRYLLETDSPYLAPVPQRGRRNEPAWVSLTAQRVAEARGESVEDVAHQTTLTFDAFLAGRETLNVTKMP